MHKMNKIVNNFLLGGGKVWTNKAFEIVNNTKYDQYQRGSASIIFNFFW